MLWILKILCLKSGKKGGKKNSANFAMEKNMKKTLTGNEDVSYPNEK
jgi:hypothetical protein